jgi:hypothetical protein
MTEKTITFKFKYENNKEFSFTCDNGEEDITIVKVEENGHLAELWPDVESICQKFFHQKLTDVGREMQMP